MRHVTGYTRKQDRQLFDKRRPWAPGKRPPKPPSTLYPGSDVRILSSAPQWAFGPNAPPVYPGHMPPPPEETKPQASTEPELETTINKTKEIVAPQPVQTTAPDARPLNDMSYEQDIFDEDDLSDPAPSAPEPPERPVPQRRIIPRVAEWLGLQPAVDAADRERKQAQKRAKAAFRAELVAGRAPAEPQQPTADLPVHVHRAAGPHASLADFSLAIARPRPAKVPPDLERHSRLCSVCSHPDRDAIEADYLHWRDPEEIAEDYGFSNFHPIYRHARATGLTDRRKGEVCRVMERYLEKVDSYSTDEFDQVTRAVRTYAHIDTDGRWFEPSRTHYILTGQLGTVTPPEPPQPMSPSDLPENLHR